MDLDDFSLIDWNTPAAELNCSKPLIPLPLCNSEIHVAGDNPFDELERQLNEHQPFDIALEGTPTTNNSCNDIFQFLTLELDKKEVQDTSGYLQPPEHRFSESKSSISDISDIIEKVQTRIQMLQTSCHDLQTPKKENVCVDESYSKTRTMITDPGSTVCTAMNEGFIWSASSWTATSPIPVDQEDICSISPPWEDFALTSSSDEETEEPVSWSTDLPFSKIEEKMDIRFATAVSKDSPTIHFKKPESLISRKEEPLKATIPVQSMMRPEPMNEDTVSTIKTCRAKNVRADSSSVTLRKRSFPAATSTPKSATYVKKTVPVTRSRRSMSPDSTCSPVFPVRFQERELSKSLAKRPPTSTINGKTPVKTKRVGNVSFAKSMANGSKSNVKNNNKENIVPFRN